MKASLNWAVIGTGGIATDFVQALEKSTRGVVVNVLGSSPAKGRAFADRWSIERASESLDQLTRDARVEAVYVASPHPAHEEQAIACIRAGKHVLCEKPLSVDTIKAERIIKAAREQRVFLMEAYMYRCHPLVRELMSRLQQGVIGDVRHLRADFGFRVERDPEHRLFSPKLGGGAILDVGGYPVSLARLIAGFIEKLPFAEPTRIDGNGYRGPAGADELASVLLTFRSGFTAQLTCAVFHEVGTKAVVFGEKGKIELPDPWIPQGDRQSLSTSFTITRYGEADEVVNIKTDKATYAIEAELVADTLPELEPPWPAMSHEDTLGNLRVMDAWRARIE